MERLIDLHNHTTASDGTLAPRRTVELARELGLAAVAVTDHDTTAGLAEACAAGQALGVEVVPGVELAADYGGKEVHVLGYFIDPAAPALTAALADAIRQRDARNERIVRAMEADGLPISMEKLRAAFPDTVLGRPHIGRYLAERGLASDLRDAITKYMRPGAPYYSPRVRMGLGEAVSVIRAAGGAASLAHPLQYGFDADALEQYLLAGRAAGALALEAYYSEHSPAQTAMLLEKAAALDMAVSGGSDFHGANKPHIRMGSGIDGGLAVPYSVLETLRRRAAAGQNANC